MKNLVLAILIVAFFSACNSTSTTTEGASNFEINERLYKRAIELEDYGTQLVALNYMLLEDTSNMAYTDSLARIYLKSGSLDVGLNLAQKVMDDNPKNYKLLEMIATAQQYKADVPNLTRSYKNFKKLYDEVGGARYKIKLAEIGMLQGNYGPALKRLDEVIEDPETTMIESPTQSGGVQMIDVKAGAYFMKANYEFNQNNERKGAEYLSEALRISPDFEAARMLAQQLQAYRQQQASSQQNQAAMKQQQEYMQKSELEKRKFEEYMKKNGGN